jgi:hypothetical protein
MQSVFPIRDLKDITTFTLPAELMTVEHCDRYISLCKKRRDSYANLPGAPRKKAVRDAWNDRIAAAEVRKTALGG